MTDWTEGDIRWIAVDGIGESYRFRESTKAKKPKKLE